MFKLPNPKGKRHDVAEVFCPPRFTPRASRFGLLPGLAFDLRSGWDLDDPRHIAALWRYLDMVKPYLVVGSPECKAFSQLRHLNKDHKDYDETLRKGMKHLKLLRNLQVPI